MDENDFGDARIFILASRQDDYASPSRGHKYVELIITSREILGTMTRSLCTGTHEHAISTAAWDLPAKRNFALALARRHSLRRIMLVDDDIRGVSREQVSRGAALLDVYDIAGCFPESFPDTSVLGHAALSVGRKVQVFLSGSFLFINTERASGFFPPIYNEDWLFMLPSILAGRIASFGTIAQVPYKPFSTPLTAVFQEFGETFVEGLFRRLAAYRSPNGAFRSVEYWGEVTGEPFWGAWLRCRRSYLARLVKSLSSRSTSRATHQILRCVDAAATQLRTFTARSLSLFAAQFLHDLGSTQINTEL